MERAENLPHKTRAVADGGIVQMAPVGKEDS